MSGRIRTIKPEILEDEKAAGLSDEAWRLWVSSWLLADDIGDLRGGDRYLAANVWQDTTREPSRAVKELIDTGFFQPYSVNGQRYVRIHAFTKHQRIDNAGKPRVPTLEDDDGVWLRELGDKFSETRRESHRDSASRGGPRCSAALPTTTTTTNDHDQRPALVLDGSAQKKSTKRQVIQSYCPADWRPSRDTLSVLDGEGIEPAVALAIVREFLEYWVEGDGARKRRTNWDLVFRTRARTLRDANRLPPPIEISEPEPPPIEGIVIDPGELAKIVSTAKANIAKAHQNVFEFDDADEKPASRADVHLSGAITPPDDVRVEPGPPDAPESISGGSR